MRARALSVSGGNLDVPPSLSLKGWDLQRPGGFQPFVSSAQREGSPLSPEWTVRSVVRALDIARQSVWRWLSGGPWEGHLYGLQISSKKLIGLVRKEFRPHLKPTEAEFAFPGDLCLCSRSTS